jgi:hypothetical protein
VARQNYQFEKRQRELEKKKKKEGKQQRKLEKPRDGDDPGATGESEDTPPAGSD